MKIFAFCGSLRANSSNLALLKALQKLAPSDVQFEIFDGLGQLPHFNADLDEDTAPRIVEDMRDKIRSSSAILISTPEYAHGIPGSLKNALDWLVSSDAVLEKPVALIYGSGTSASFAHQALAEVLKTMSMKLIPEADAFIPGARTKIAPDGQIQNPAVQETLRKSLETVLKAALSR